ncbi:MAG: YraN family protein [Terriglobales bacterium]|jgi:putative endonuclease
MLKGRLTHGIVRLLDWGLGESADDSPEHLRTGRRGEEDAYFYLRRCGYTIISRNYRSPHYRGELDLVGWDGDVLCFVEVKTRTTRAVKPAEAAVDRDKQNELRLMARDFMQHMAGPCQWRFDIVTIYYDHGFNRPSFELFQNAFSVAYNRGFAKRLARSY